MDLSPASLSDDTFKSPQALRVKKFDDNSFKTPTSVRVKPSSLNSGSPITISDSPVGDCSSFKTPTMARVKSSSLGSAGSPLTIPASPFMKKLGCGTGVSVYLMKRVGTLNASPWAIKKINSKCESRQLKIYQKRLDEEAKILKELVHPNIVGFRAQATASDGSKCLAMEYGGEQSLNDLIEKRKEQGLGAFPAATIQKVALHVARGLQYLHTEKKLLHGDMKSCNVVIKGDFETIKICDVGVSLRLDENMTVSDPKAVFVGTEPWKPKECLDDGGVITDKSDIFSYGLTLWEMMALDIPHLDMPDEYDDETGGDTDDEGSWDEDAYYEKLGTRPALDYDSLDACYRRVIELFCLCSEEDPNKRPSAAQIVQALEDNAQQEDSRHHGDDSVIIIDSE